ncbi:hypothetical protein GCM10007359_11730 [Rothia aerolata]|uniref:Uncharacterized protein n=1 Tax=Rothia aerolata TaxID=1812262 RepID=A0A917IT46_9MICC|nr:hypothetical protein GCM10007359_11730 [Rothia aerolata]
MEAVPVREAGSQQLQPWEAIGKRRGGEVVVMGKLLRVGGMRRCYPLAYTPGGYIWKGGGGHGPHAGQGTVTEQPPHCREGTAGGGG